MVKYSFLHPNPRFLPQKQVFYSLVAALFSDKNSLINFTQFSASKNTKNFDKTGDATNNICRVGINITFVFHHTRPHPHCAGAD